MKIGAFAAACGTSVRMLRFYEEAGILQPARSPGNYRLYSADDVGYVRKVIMLNQVGLSLKDIAIMRDCLHDRPQDFCPELRHKLQVVRDKIDEKISSLKRSQALLAELLDEGA